MQRSEFESAGFEIVLDVLSESECAACRDQLTANVTGAGTRRLLDYDWCRNLVVRLRNHAMISDRLPDDAVAVQCTLFDKSARTNWLVGMHQDVSIPVRARIADERCTGWSQKEGVTFAQPPVDVLERLIALRVHIDDSALDNGPLRVVPGSHRSGRLSAHDSARHHDMAEDTICIAPVGSLMLMRPLLLHASSKALTPRPRRVLHFLFGPRDLPFGLQWHQAV